MISEADVNTFIETIEKEIKKDTLKEKYSIGTTEFNVSGIRESLKKRIRAAVVRRCGYRNSERNDGKREAFDQEVQRLRTIIIRLEDNLFIHEETKNLYEKLKREYQVLYGRYEMLRVQYVRVRTSSKMTGTPPTFVAGRSHPDDPDRKYITNLSKLHDTQKILRGRGGGEVKGVGGLDSDDDDDEEGDVKTLSTTRFSGE